jgi:succinyl-CoA synthetase beta subunit
VQLVKTPEEVEAVAQKMCGNTLITKQSGADGLVVSCVYVVEKVGIKKEFYLSLTLDRKSGCPVFIYS